MNHISQFFVMIDEIEGMTVMVSDQQKALEFYTEKLGFETKLDTDVAGFRWIVVGPKNSNTVISLADPTSVEKWSEKKSKKLDLKIGTSTGIWFFTKNIDDTYHELQSKGVEITKPEKQVWGGIMSTLFDQDKNSFGLVGDSEKH